MTGAATPNATASHEQRGKQERPVHDRVARVEAGNGILVVPLVRPCRREASSGPDRLAGAAQVLRASCSNGDVLCLEPAGHHAHGDTAGGSHESTGSGDEHTDESALRTCRGCRHACRPADEGLHRGYVGARSCGPGPRSHSIVGYLLGRGRLASSPALPHPRREDEGQVGAGTGSGPGPRTRRPPAAAPAVGPLHRAQEGARGRQRRDRPRAGRLVLVPGRHGRLTRTDRTVGQDTHDDQEQAPTPPGSFLLGQWSAGARRRQSPGPRNNPSLTPAPPVAKRSLPPTQKATGPRRRGGGRAWSDLRSAMSSKGTHTPETTLVT